MLKIIILVFLCVIVNCQQNTYRAAVLEYHPISDGSTPKDIIRRNLDIYLWETNKARDAGADIIVFPEYGLTGLVDEVEKYSIKLPTAGQTVDIIDADIVRRLGNAAIENQIYIVVNLLEKANDTRNNTLYYNTNVVFARTGEIIAKYRKINLYGESKLTPGNETVTFDTTFGVTFGLMTCFDILFENPSRLILRNQSVTDIIYPHAWHNTLPFYAATSLQHGYSQANGINLLSAAFNDPQVTLGGSGIYLGDGSIPDVYLNPNTESKLIVQPLPKRTSRYDTTKCLLLDSDTNSRRRVSLGGILPKDKTIADFKTDKDFSSKKYKFADVDISKGHIEQKICYDDLCCFFNLNISAKGLNDTYKLVAYSGPQQVGNDSRNINFCSLVHCQSSDSESCGDRVQPNTMFTQLIVKVSLTDKKNTSYLQPNTLTSDLTPVQNNYFCNSREKGKYTLQLRHQGPVYNLLNFGFFGVSSSPVLSCNLCLLLLFSTVFATIFNV